MIFVESESQERHFENLDIWENIKFWYDQA